MSLDAESEREYSLRLGLVRQNCSWGSLWCGTGLVNVNFEINIATSVTAVGG